MTTTFTPHIHQTDLLVIARRRVLEAAKVRRPLVVIGPSGSGKTTAVTRAVEFAGDQLKARAVTVLASRYPAPVDFIRAVIEAITGESYAKLTGARLNHVLIDLLREEPTIVMVDEAARLRPAALDVIQYIWELQRFCIVLVAVPELIDSLNKATTLTSRSDRVRFALPNDDEIVDITAAMHPAFGAAAPNAIRSFNQYARSNLHVWLRASEKIDEWVTTYNAEPVLDHDMVQLLRRELG